MHGPMHIHITETAINWLTGDCAAFWTPLKKIAAKASNYPDYFAAGGASAEKNKQIDNDWCEYNIIPETNETAVHAFIKPLELRDTYPPIINYWNSKTVENIKTGSGERAAKFAGCLSHLIGDSGQAAHTFDERPLKKLIPHGDKRFIIHSTIEKVTGIIEKKNYVPRNLGGSLNELNWRLLEELEILIHRNTAEVIPVLTAIMNGDDKSAEASASRSLTLCAELLADLLFSLWSIAYGKGSGLGNELDLRGFVPVRQRCDMLFNYEIMTDRIPGKSIDDSVTLDLGSGDVNGIALLADMAPSFSKVRKAFVEYSIPASVFKSFEAEIGLNRNSVNETKAIFRIKLDGKTVFSSKALGTVDPAVKVKIELGKGRRLRLYVRDIRSAPCDTKFFYPVFAYPRLTGRCHRSI